MFLLENSTETKKWLLQQLDTCAFYFYCFFFSLAFHLWIRCFFLFVFLLLSGSVLMLIRYDFNNAPPDSPCPEDFFLQLLAKLSFRFANCVVQVIVDAASSRSITISNAMCFREQNVVRIQALSSQQRQQQQEQQRLFDCSYLCAIFRFTAFFFSVSAPAFSWFCLQMF